MNNENEVTKEPKLHEGVVQASDVPAQLDGPTERKNFRAALQIFGLGALVGVVLRLIFSGVPGGGYSAMNGSFIFLAPLAVSSVAVYLAEKQKRRTWQYYAYVGAVTNVIFVIGTLVILIEGIICVIVIAPMFAAIGAIGGVLMGAVCRITNWPKHATFSFVALPLLMGLIEPTGAGPALIGKVERSIRVNAAPEEIWRQLLNTKDIRPDEVGDAWMYRIGVPLPIAGVTKQRLDGTLAREVTMGKSIHFEQISTKWQKNQHVSWKYHFSEDSFPPAALDDHVRIGGHYFDLIDTEYTITQIGPNASMLSIRMHYRVSTQFNWYADSVGKFLIGNFAEVILNFYRKRSEHT